MSEARVGKHTFVYNGERYFRNKSENVLMCSVGEKDDPLGPKASINVIKNLDPALLKGKVRYVTTADVEWSRQTQADVETEGKLKYFTVEAAGTAAFSYEKAKSGRLKLAKFVIDEGPLQSMLNNDAGGAKRILAREGQGGRIVSTIWVVVEGAIADSFAAAGTTTGAIQADVLSAAKLRLSVQASVGARGTTAIELEEGTTFAYLLHRVKKWNKDKTRIEELDVDAKGLD